jgi:molecular chaperone DnaK
MAATIGIDLGTTFSCVAYLEGANPQIIPNVEGLNTTPSVVTFTSSGEKLIGNLALRQAKTNPENTIYAVKRLIGKKFNSEDVTEARKRVTYELAEAENGDVLVVVDSEKISPQEISAMILSYLKESAEEFFGEEVKDAIVTVPAHFNDSQRQATKDAAKIAGLNVLRVINEPTAASLAYGLTDQKNVTVAIYDLVGGTFDISILEIYDGVYNVRATNGNSFLGGEDFDNRILRWLIEEFNKENNIDLSQDKFAIQRIKEASEKAKCDLSFALESEINLPFIYSGSEGSKHLKKILTRQRLEELTSDLIDKTIPYVNQALEDAKLKPQDIEEFILVGGQAQMPLVKKVLTDYFGKEPSKAGNPEEVVAQGAAIQSGIIVGDMKDIVLLDVTSLSLGIETEHDTFTKIIERNTTIPTKQAIPFTTVEHNQNTVRIHVLQGEREIATENKSLGKFFLVGIEPAPAGLPQIDVTFEIDADGIAKVSARDKGTGKQQQIEVKPSSGLSEDEINKIIKEAEEHAAKDRKMIQVKQVRGEIEKMVVTLESYFYRDDKVLSFLNKEDIQKILAEKQKIMQSEDLDQLESFKMQVKKYTKTIERVLAESTESDEPLSAEKKSEEGGDE